MSSLILEHNSELWMELGGCLNFINAIWGIAFSNLNVRENYLGILYDADFWTMSPSDPFGPGICISSSAPANSEPRGQSLRDEAGYPDVRGKMVLKLVCSLCFCSLAPDPLWAIENFLWLLSSSQIPCQPPPPNPPFFVCVHVFHLCFWVIGLVLPQELYLKTIRIPARV